MNLQKTQWSTAPCARRHQLVSSFLVALFAAGLACVRGAESGGGATPAGAGAGAAFQPTHKTSFYEVTSQLDAGGRVYVYLATDQWLAGLTTNLSRVREVILNAPGGADEEREQVGRVLGLIIGAIRESGLPGLSGVGLSSAQVAPELYRAKLVLHHQPGQGEGLLWNLFGAQAHPLRALDLLPKTTALAAFGDVDIARLWGMVARAVADSHIPELAPVLDLPREFQRATQLSWTNALASFGGEVGVILTLDDANKLTIPLGPQSLELPEPGLMAVVKVNNDTLYNRLTQELKGNPQTTVTEEAGLKMCALPVPLPLPLQVQLTVASSGDYLFVASSPALVRAALEARSRRAPGLSQAAEFKALRPYLPEQGNQFAYVGRAFSEAIRQIQTRAMEANPDIARAMAPLRELLMAGEPDYGLMIGGHSATGWQLVAVGNHDSSAALLVAPAAGGVAIPAAMLLPALSRAKDRAQSISCENNLKQIGLSFKVYALDNNDRYPFNVPAKDGGTLEACARGTDGFDQNSYKHFMVMSNELSTPKVLVCPADKGRQPADSFLTLQAANVTYQVRSGTNVNENTPQEVLARCPIHGHELLCDGSVRRGQRK